MKFKAVGSLLLGLALALTLSISARSDGDREDRDRDRDCRDSEHHKHNLNTPVKLIGVMPVPGNPLTSFDISWVDQPSERYFVADKNNKSVDVYDAENDLFLFAVPGFVGLGPGGPNGGPNGILVTPNQHLWAGDAKGLIQVWDVNPSLPAPIFLKTIATGGLHRADEEAYDVKRHIIMMVDDAEDPFPIAFFYNADTYAFLGKIVFTNAINGLEQAVWDPETGKFLVPVPETSNTPQHSFGEVDVIDTSTLPISAANIVARFPNEDCGAHGMALGPFQHLLLGCSDSNSNAGAPAVNPLPLKTIIINARNGHLIATIPVGKADEVWYNSGDDRFYLAGSQLTDGPNPNPPPVANLTTRVLNVIDAETNTLLQSIPSSAFTGAHSVAVFAENNHVFVPFLSPANPKNLDVCATFGFPGKGCIGIYTHESEPQESEEAGDHDGGDGHDDH